LSALAHFRWATYLDRLAELADVAARERKT
jgi:hypothetical protein